MIAGDFRIDVKSSIVDPSVSTISYGLFYY